MQTNRKNTGRRPRRSGSRFVPKLLTLLVIVVLVILGISLFFKVETIQVRDPGPYTDEEVIAASGIMPGDNMLLLDKAQAASKIKVTLSYVQSVRIRRQLPGTVILELTQCQPIAALITEYNELWLISSEGKLLEQVTEEQAADYLLITGFPILLPTAGEQPSLEDGSEEKLSAALQISNALQQLSLDPPVTKIDISELYDITLYCGDRFEVRIGTVQNIDYKLRYLQAAVAQLADDQSGIIDLSFDEDGIARFIPW